MALYADGCTMAAVGLVRRVCTSECLIRTDKYGGGCTSGWRAYKSAWSSTRRYCSRTRPYAARYEAVPPYRIFLPRSTCVAV
eukprot:1896293-Rhodomonas_salina.1